MSTILYNSAKSSFLAGLLDKAGGPLWGPPSVLQHLKILEHFLKFRKLHRILGERETQAAETVWLNAPLL
jgi:hypothetical protein